MAKIKGAITDYLTHNRPSDTSLATHWAALKSVLRGEFIALSAAANAERARKREELSSRTKELKQIHQRTEAPRVWRQLRLARQQLAALDQNRAEYAALRVRHTYYTGDDRCGRLLGRALRELQKRHTVQEIHTHREGIK